MDQEFLKVFFYDVRCAVVMHFLRLERNELRWRRTAVRRSFVRNELDYCVDVCRITKGAHIEHL
jgi:hypothetical protein